MAEVSVTGSYVVLLDSDKNSSTESFRVRHDYDSYPYDLFRVHESGLAQVLAPSQSDAILQLSAGDPDSSDDQNGVRLVSKYQDGQALLIQKYASESATGLAEVRLRGAGGYLKLLGDPSWLGSNGALNLVAQCDAGSPPSTELAVLYGSSPLIAFKLRTDGFIRARHCAYGLGWWTFEKTLTSTDVTNGYVDVDASSTNYLTRRLVGVMAALHHAPGGASTLYLMPYDATRAPFTVSSAGTTIRVAIRSRTAGVPAVNDVVRVVLFYTHPDP